MFGDILGISPKFTLGYSFDILRNIYKEYLYLPKCVGDNLHFMKYIWYM